MTENELGRELYYGETSCLNKHDLTGANGLIVGEDAELGEAKLCRTCRGIGNRSYGSEWRNGRGQVFVFLPDHPHSRKDGFYPRAKVVMEEKEGRLLDPQERVLHLNEQPDDDRPSNLKLFPSQHALAQYRSKKYQAKKKKLGGGWAALTPAQRAYQEQMARERELAREIAEKEAARERSNEALRKANEKRKKDKK